MTCITPLTKMPVKFRCGGYYLRWYYNGWHYWYWYPGKINLLTEGENYRTIGTQRLTIGSGQITDEQVTAIRTIANTREIDIWTDYGWTAVRLEHTPIVTYDHAIHGYDVEITIIIGSRRISSTGYSPAIHVPIIPSPITIKYGAMYNYYAATDIRHITSAGWSVATKAQTLILIAELGGLAVAGGEVKEIGTTYWDAPNTGATNSSKFNARGNGYKVGFTGVSAWLNQLFTLWTSSPNGVFYADAGYVPYNNTVFGVGLLHGGNNSMRAIRPLKDFTTLTNGESGTYIDPSGKTYRTICVGTQEWVADNIYTEHFRNGDPIPIMTDVLDYKVNSMIYYLPTVDELVLMYQNLHLFAVGNFQNAHYWTSEAYDDNNGNYVDFADGSSNYDGKGETKRVRGYSVFEAGIGDYSLRDIGINGGLIFYIDGTTYYEAAISDLTSVWSNIVDVGGVGYYTGVGLGYANTEMIIEQAGHIDSAAYQCFLLNPKVSAMSIYNNDPINI
jgi:hypothetical protein